MTREEREACVDWFCERMKAKMRLPQNEAKPSWRNDPPGLLRRFLAKELDELDEVMCTKAIDPMPLDELVERVVDECCDVAAFSMFIADRVCQLRNQRAALAQPPSTSGSTETPPSGSESP